LCVQFLCADDGALSAQIQFFNFHLSRRPIFVFTH